MAVQIPQEFMNRPGMLTGTPTPVTPKETSDQ